MRVQDLVIGKRYKIRYRNFNHLGNPIPWSTLRSGEGKLLGIQDVSYYNHRFILDDGTEVWATSNSIKEIEDPLLDFGKPAIGLSSKESADLAKNVSCFLEGLGIQNRVDQSFSVTIPANGLSAMKSLLGSLYAKALLED